MDAGAFSITPLATEILVPVCTQMLRRTKAVRRMSVCRMSFPDHVFGTAPAQDENQLSERMMSDTGMLGATGTACPRANILNNGHGKVQASDSRWIGEVSGAARSVPPLPRQSNCLLHGLHTSNVSSGIVVQHAQERGTLVWFERACEYRQAYHRKGAHMGAFGYLQIHTGA